MRVLCLTVLLTVALAGCSSRERETEFLPQSAGPPVTAGQPFSTSAFDVQAPVEPGWVLIRANDSLVVFGRVGPRARASYTASVWATTLQAPPTDAEFKELVDELRRAETHPARYKLVRSSDRSVSDKDGPGVAYETAVEIRGSRGIGKGKNVVALDIHAVIRQHPTRKNIVLTAQYTHRRPVRRDDAELAEKAQAFLGGVKPKP